MLASVERVPHLCIENAVGDQQVAAWRWASTLESCESPASLRDDQTGCRPVPLETGTLLDKHVCCATRDKQVSPGIADAAAYPRLADNSLKGINTRSARELFNGGMQNKRRFQLGD
jgi:hypothetical protein